MPRSPRSRALRPDHGAAAADSAGRIRFAIRRHRLGSRSSLAARRLRPARRSRPLYFSSSGSGLRPGTRDAAHHITPDRPDRPRRARRARLRVAGTGARSSVADMVEPIRLSRRHGVAFRAAAWIVSSRSRRQDALMIKVHHLENRRSQRILWLLEELGLPYEVVRYERDTKTMLAPPALRQVHPLGKSPVIEDRGPGDRRDRRDRRISGREGGRAARPAGQSRRGAALPPFPPLCRRLDDAALAGLARRQPARPARQAGAEAAARRCSASISTGWKASWPSATGSPATSSPPPT